MNANRLLLLSAFLASSSNIATAMEKAPDAVNEKQKQQSQVNLEATKTQATGSTGSSTSSPFPSMAELQASADAQPTGNTSWFSNLSLGKILPSKNELRSYVRAIANACTSKITSVNQTSSKTTSDETNVQSTGKNSWFSKLSLPWGSSKTLTAEDFVEESSDEQSILKFILLALNQENETNSTAFRSCQDFKNVLSEFAKKEIEKLDETINQLDKINAQIKEANFFEIENTTQEKLNQAKERINSFKEKVIIIDFLSRGEEFTVATMFALNSTNNIPRLLDVDFIKDKFKENDFLIVIVRPASINQWFHIVIRKNSKKKPIFIEAGPQMKNVLTAFNQVKSYFGINPAQTETTTEAPTTTPSTTTEVTLVEEKTQAKETTEVTLVEEKTQTAQTETTTEAPTTTTTTPSTTIEVTLIERLLFIEEKTQAKETTEVTPAEEKAQAQETEKVTPVEEKTPAKEAEERKEEVVIEDAPDED